MLDQFLLFILLAALLCAALWFFIRPQPNGNSKPSKADQPDSADNDDPVEPYVLEQLTGGIAHDFNNVLGTLLGVVQLAEKNRGPEDLAANLAIARRAIKQGRELTDQLVAFSGMATTAAEELAMRQIVLNAIVHLQSESESKLPVTENVENNLMVFCDPSQLQFTIERLITDKRTQIARNDTKSIVNVHGRKITRQGNQFAELTVALNRSDMANAEATDPISSWQQRNETHLSKAGQAAPLIAHFIRQSNGELTTEEDPHLGEVSKLLLPAVVPEGCPPPGQKLGSDAGMTDIQTDGTGRRVLLVEDEERLLAVMSKLLHMCHFDVLSATSGVEALQIVRNEPHIDLLLTDVVMPGGINGFELAEQVQDYFPGVPTVYTSGYIGFSKDNRMRVNGPVVRKPCDLGELCQAMNSVMS